MHKVLLVDDEKNILSGYRRNLRTKFHIYVSESGKGGLDILRNNGPFAAVVSDYKMPEMNGIEFLSKVRDLYPDTVRVMLTGYADLDAAVNAINEGNIFRFLSKPCKVELLAKNIYDAIGQYQLITAEKELLNKTLKGSIKTLIDILAAVNPEAFSQAAQMRSMARKILARLRIQNSWEVEIGTLLSKIGLVTVPQSIIRKKYQGAELTADEEKMFFHHAQIGNELLKHIPRLEKIAEGINYQYACYNGEGESIDFKVGDNIPFLGRLLKVLNDFYSPINKGAAPNEALRIIQKKHEIYDPDILGALIAEVQGLSEGSIISMKKLTELKIGMLLAEGIKDINGFLLVPKGNELTNISLMKILNYNKMTKIQEPIKIIESTI
ncbi:MAG: response regulator [Chlorobi bacterium]|nr:response regulator [Chlorobiota bacterium]